MPSTVIRSARYDAKRCELTVVFQSGRRYAYGDVPTEIFVALESAPSRGEYFNRFVRDSFTCRRIDDDA